MYRLNIWAISEIRSRYTDQENRCREDIGKLAYVAIAYDISTLAHECDLLIGESRSLAAEVQSLKVLVCAERQSFNLERKDLQDRIEYLES